MSLPAWDLVAVVRMIGLPPFQWLRSMTVSAAPTAFVRSAPCDSHSITSKKELIASIESDTCGLAPK